MSDAMVPIKISVVDRLSMQGYSLLKGCDAAKANSDYFAIMVRHRDDGGSDIQILCPTFLRGALGFSIDGGISY